MIYTSYFGNLRKINRISENIIPVSICAKSPKWYNGIKYKKLVPEYSFFINWKRSGDNDCYIREYNNQILNKLNVTNVVEELYKLSNNKDIVLLCYEKPNNFSHRYLVANWFRNNGIMCEEIQI